MSDLNRNGEPFGWPKNHDFGRFERAYDGLLLELRKVPPYSWAKWIITNGYAYHYAVFVVIVISLIFFLDPQ